MSNELEDWQLALLVEARSFQNPSLVEAEEAEALRDAQKFLNQAEDVESPVIVDRKVKESYEENEALREAAQGIDDWEVVPADQRAEEQEACEAVKDVLSDALKENHGLREGVVSDMSALSMVNQFRDDDEGSISLEALTQTPETGGSPDDSEDVEANEDGSNGDGENPLESLSAAEREDVKNKLEKADMMESRTPDYADSLRAEAAEIAGLEDADDIQMEAL